MRYRIRFTYRDGSSGLLGTEYTTRTEAELEIARRSNPNNCMTYTIEEALPTPTGAVIDARRKAFDAWMEDEGKPFLGTLNETHRRLAEHVLWNAFKAGEKHAEIVDLCERMEGGL